MSDKDKISPYNIKQTSDETEEKCQMRRSLVDPIRNSPK